MKDVLLHGCYDNRNFGDVLMADMLSNYLARKDGVTVQCPGMLDDIAAKMPCSPTGNIRGPIKCQLAVYGGGGYLHGASFRNEKRLLRYALVGSILRARKIPYCLVGVGAGPLIKGLSKVLVRHLLNGARTIAVRETQSRDLLAEIGVPLDKIEVTADLVMSLMKEDIPAPAIERASRVLSNAENQSGKRRIGVHLSVPVHESEVLASVLRNVRAGLSGNEDIEVYWIQDHGNRTDDFTQISSENLANCKVLPPLPHWELVAVLAQMDMVLTTKLHVAIASWALGKPVCGYSNHQKTERFFSQIDRAKYQIMRDQDPGVISGWISDFVCQEPVFFDDNKTIRKNLVEKSQRNFKHIDNLFTNQ